MKNILLTMIFLTIPLVAFAQAGKDITVISREFGSGTRGAFVELMEITTVNAAGNKKDGTTKDAIIANKTDMVMASVAGNPYSIGYISMGSLNNRIKAVSIDGAAPTVENIKNGTYKIARPFNIALSPKANPAAQDFVDFILSKEGQATAAKNYIPVNQEAAKYSGTKPSGRLTVAGSSSVAPVMEKLKEAYNKVNPNLKIEIQQNDSSTGIQAAINGTCDIGMSSRDLKANELGSLKPVPIAIDGIAVIVNNKNSVSNLTSKEVRDIFTGNKTKW